LRVLVQHAGKVLTHCFLLKELWDQLTDAQYLQVYIRQLRQKIEAGASAVCADRNGYRLSPARARLVSLHRASECSVGTIAHDPELVFQQREDTMARKYSRKASAKVGRAMRKRKAGTLKSGRSGRKVKSRKQAIAIGLSEARREGKKVPPKKSSKRKSSKRKSSKRR
jgi:hypothetical protein